MAEEKLEAARPALEEAEAALQVKNIFIVQSWGNVWRGADRRDSRSQSRANYSVILI